MSFSAQILADSVSDQGIRLTTFEVEYPHAIHKDIMTHRMFSRNFLSFRAYPPEKVIENIQADAFWPESFDSRVTGMGQGQAIAQQDVAEGLWSAHVAGSLETAQAMLGLDLAKAQVNFVLQDLTWIRGIITATDWDNFWALRAAPDNVRPEVKRIASMMFEQYEAGTPHLLKQGEWHLPLLQPDEQVLVPRFTTDPAPTHWDFWKKISTGRCARTSYLTHHGVRDQNQDIRLHDGLLADGHMSPFEHVARPFTQDEVNAIADLKHEIEAYYIDYVGPEVAALMVRQLDYRGNFRGWHQYRLDIPAQHDFSLREAA